MQDAGHHAGSPNGAPSPTSTMAPGSFDAQRAAMAMAYEQRNKLAQAAAAAAANGPVASTSTAGAPAQQQPLALSRSHNLNASTSAVSHDFLPGGLPTNILYTRVAPLRKSDILAEPTEAEQAKLKAWIAKDHWYEQLQQEERRGQKVKAGMAVLLEDLLTPAQETLSDIQAEEIRRTDWLGNAPGQLAGTAWAHAQPGGSFRLRYPHDRRIDLSRGKRKSRVEQVTARKDLTARQLASIVDDEEWLVPIRVDWEHEGIKVRDTFTWNMRDAHITPELFAKMLCEDLLIPPQAFLREITHQIHAQLEDSRRIAYRDNITSQRPEHEQEHDDMDETADEQFWGRWRKRVRLDNDAQAIDLDDDVQAPEDTDSAIHEELRILIKLDITYASMNLVDQFEWDIADPRNSPEVFAQRYATDLGLPGEFVTTIAHNVREQVEIYAKSLGLIEHRPGTAVSNDDLKQCFLPPVLGRPFRVDTAVSDFTPKLDHLTPDELERNDKEREREARRKRRQTRGRQQITLPDRDAPKTNRTLMPAPGAIPMTSNERDSDTWAVPVFPVARPYPIIRNTADLVKPTPLLRPDSPPAVKKPPANWRGRGRGRGRGGRGGGHESSRAGSATPGPAGPLAYAPPVPAPHRGPGEPTPQQLNDWLPMAESPVVSVTPYNPYAHQPPSSQPYGHPMTYHHPPPVAPPVYPQQLYQQYARPQPSPASTMAPPSSHATKAIAPGPAPASKSIRRGSPEAPAPVKATPIRRAAVAAAMRATTSPLSSGTESSEEEPIRRPPRRAPPPPARDGSVDEGSAPPFRRGPPPPPAGQAPGVSGSPNHQAQIRNSPPAWLALCASGIRTSKPDHKFEIVPRPKAAADGGMPSTEWRIRCVDCPGKLYTPGPGESLDNFEVHLKNRQHRANVETRIGRPPGE